jgi:hypothetical protein
MGSPGAIIPWFIMPYKINHIGNTKASDTVLLQSYLTDSVADPDTGSGIRDPVPF